MVYVKANAIIVINTTVHLTVKMNFGQDRLRPTNQGLQGKQKIGAKSKPMT